MSYAIARQQVRDDIARAHTFIADKLTIAASAPGLGHRDIRHIERLTTDDPASIRLSLARFDVAEASSLALVDALHAHWQAHCHLADFRYWLGTLCWDAGVVPLAAGYLDPAVIAAMMLKVYKALQAHGFHALILLEVEILMRLAGDGSPRLMYHIHPICWRYDAPVRPRALAAALMAGNRFPNDLGARSVVFTTNRWPRRTPSTDLEPLVRPRGHPPLTAHSVAGLAAYVTKYPACVKVLRPDRRDPDGLRWHLDTDQTKNSAALVLALAEARSQLPLLTTVKGLGEGAQVRSAWKRGVEQRLGNRR